MLPGGSALQAEETASTKAGRWQPAQPEDGEEE